MNTICNRAENCHGQEYVERLKCWPQTDIAMVESYRQTIDDAVDKAFQDSSVSSLESALPKLSCLKCEELNYFAPRIREERLSTSSVYRKVYRFSRFRMGRPWFASLIRQTEALHVNQEDAREEYDEDGNRLDYGIVLPEGELLFNLGRVGVASPEEVLLTEERLNLLPKAISEIESSRTCRASTHAKILKLQLSGIDVGREHASLLDVPAEEVASLKCQSSKRLCRVMAKFDPSLSEKQSRYNDEVSLKRKSEKSTFEDRLAQYYPTEEDNPERKPRTIFIWTRKDGWLEHEGYSKEDLPNLPPPPWINLA